ncbi:fungal chitosanase of glycosyl hydrolase group 75-domain-containing protein [Aspergillus desertorum]
MSANKCFRLMAVLFFFTSVLCHDTGRLNDDQPSRGPPASYFSAAPTMPVAALQSAASRLGRTSRGGSFGVSFDSSERSSIYSDWASFNEGAAVVWRADMDVDCDGIDYRCKGNADGLPETSWGALAAYEVPFIVIPESYLDAHEAGLPGNNVAAVICNGNMFYGILGDTNGGSPEVTGEASWLMARTCFPTEGLSGAIGHGGLDITCIYSPPTHLRRSRHLTVKPDIVFLGEEAVLPDSAMNKKYVTDFGTLRSMGDALVNALMRNIGLGAGARTRTHNASFSTVAPATTSHIASFLTARSWTTLSRLLEPSAVLPGDATFNSASDGSASSSLAVANASTSVTSSPQVSPPSIATPSSSTGVASSNLAAAGVAGPSALPSNTALGVAAVSPAAAASNTATPNAPPPRAASSAIPDASVATPSAIAPSSIPRPSPSAAASVAPSGPSSAAASASTPANPSSSDAASRSSLSSNAASPNAAVPSGGAANVSGSATGSASVVSPSVAVSIAAQSATATPGAAFALSTASTAVAVPEPTISPSTATSSASVPGASSPSTSNPSCSWPGHCLGMVS